MIKECKIVLTNDKIIVVEFENKKIQIPNSKLIDKYAYVKLEKGKYSVVPREEYLKYKNQQINKRKILIDKEDAGT